MSGFHLGILNTLQEDYGFKDTFFRNRREGLIIFSTTIYTDCFQIMIGRAPFWPWENFFFFQKILTAHFLFLESKWSQSKGVCIIHCNVTFAVM
jgi:hypothetical protein